jgi:serine/threonine protein phosphatase PrpC
MALARTLLAGVDLDAGRIESLAGGAAAAYTRRAPAKETVNEDAVLLMELGPRAGLLAVADGTGGGPVGEVAARITLEQIAHTVETAAATDTPLREAVLTGIENANREVLALGVGAATTLVAVEIQDHAVRTYHVGDSMALVVGQRGKLKLQTVSHSPIGYAVESGMMDEGEAMQHEQRHLVSNLIGSNDMRVEMGSTLELAPRDTVLLASDGLFDNLQIPEITERVRRGPIGEAMNTVVEETRRRMVTPGEDTPCKPDDLAVIMFRPA